MNDLLFLCTGNYYRSRFCEEYFNYRAQHLALPWRAFSRGLAPDITVFRNPGPISPKTQEALEALRITLGSDIRFPISVHPFDFAEADRVIALSRCEHQPMAQLLFPTHEPTIEYWEVGDLPLESPTSAISKMTELVDQLVDEIQRALGDAALLEPALITR